jgi:hypothetical protein
MALALAVFAPNLWWNARNGWPTLRHTADISHLGTDTGLHWNHALEFAGGQFAVMGPVLFGAWLYSTLRRPVNWRDDAGFHLLACFAWPFLGIIVLQALLGRANANWGAMAYFTGTIFVVAWCLRSRHRRLLMAAVAFNAALMPLAYHFDFAARTLNVALTARTDPYKRVRGWAELGRQAQVLQLQFPNTLFLGDSRDMLSELMYYVHPHPLNAVLWNPKGLRDNHYALTTTMDDKRGRDFLYITDKPRPDEDTVDSFQSVDELPPLHVGIHPDYALHYNVYLLHNFGGYR